MSAQADRALLTDEEKREKNRARARAWNAANPDRHRARSAAWEAANPERARARKAAVYAANRDVWAARSAAWNIANRDKVRAYNAARPPVDPAVICARAAKRRAAKLQATPRWLGPEHHDAILEWYRAAQRDGLEVDHIVPLQGKNVCGLHVPWNMALLTSAENKSKGNRCGHLHPRG